MSYDPNTPSNPSYPPPPANTGTQGYGNAPAYTGGPGGYPGGQPQQGNGLAIAGLVCGIVGIFIFNIVLGPLALIFGFIGLNRANKGAKFKGMAIAAIILGAIDIILFVVALAFLSSNGFTY
ncbi:DUF4190 domain-containing protein [Jatrophihabitans sp. YIM 134969]